MSMAAAATMGLSPLARGNPHFRQRAVRLGGPIPAGAGQPMAPPALEAQVAEVGLSPLARGNHRKPKMKTLKEGPIPAGAGQPRTCGC